MKVHWTDTAEGQLDAIYKYIAQNSTTYAMHCAQLIKLQVDQNK